MLALSVGDHEALLRFELDERAFELDGEVVFANAPGNLRSSNPPLGMDVRFGEAPSAAPGTLRRFIQRRAEVLQIERFS